MSKRLCVHFVVNDDDERSLCGRAVVSPWLQSGVVALPLDLVGANTGGIYNYNRHCKQCMKHPDYALARLAVLP